MSGSLRVLKGDVEVNTVTHPGAVIGENNRFGSGNGTACHAATVNRLDGRGPAAGAPSKRKSSTVRLLLRSLPIGASTAMFSIVNGLLLRELPYPEAGGLVELNHFYPSLDNLEASVSAVRFRCGTM